MEECLFRAVPYFSWGNRGVSDMDVWVPYIRGIH
ncbi:hypothetical protein [Diplocloster modestus]